MSSTTLVSFAMLKIRIDMGGDYLDYLVPFIIQVLVDHYPDRVTDEIVKKHILNDYGLEIPGRTIQIVLKRISQKGLLEKVDHIYRIKGEIPDSDITLEKRKAQRHIDSVVRDLIEFSQDSPHPITNEEEAFTAICAFLREFEIPCLRAYLRGTTIPDIQGNSDVLVTLVGKYALKLHEEDSILFKSFMVLVKGHMLANALLCPDLPETPNTYEEVTFYLDTPLILQLLGLKSKAEKDAMGELAALLKRLGAKTVIFTHTRDEVVKVINGSAFYLDKPEGRGSIVMEARKRGTTKSDFLFLAKILDEKLVREGIEICKTPPYSPRFQIDERLFEGALKSEINYFNPKAVEYDVNSVRSIYELRFGTSPSKLEKCQAVFVTSNSTFAKEAFKYGREHEESREVSSVITDFSLANMAWLKMPMEESNLPMAEVLAFSYAAQRPSDDFFENFLAEVEKQEKQGIISPDDHSLLRSNVLAHDVLSDLTLGNESALTGETISEVLARVKSEMAQDHHKELGEEKDEHNATKQELERSQRENVSMKESIYLTCVRQARALIGAAYTMVALICFLLLYGASQLLVDGIWSNILGATLGVLGLTSLVGYSLKKYRKRVEDWVQSKIIVRQERIRGVDLSEFTNKDLGTPDPDNA